MFTGSVQFGRSRLSLAFGVAGADNLGTQTVAVSKRYKSPSSTTPSDTTEAYVAVLDSSTSRVVPMLFLHARLIEIPLEELDGVQATFGATLHKESGATELEYLVGGSLSGFDERMYLTVGEYFGQVSTLGGGLTAGDRVPDGTTASDIPVRKRFVGRVGFALSFSVPLSTFKK